MHKRKGFAGRKKQIVVREGGVSCWKTGQACWLGSDVTGAKWREALSAFTDAPMAALGRRSSSCRDANEHRLVRQLRRLVCQLLTGCHENADYSSQSFILAPSPLLPLRDCTATTPCLFPSLTPLARTQITPRGYAFPSSPCQRLHQLPRFLLALITPCLLLRLRVAERRTPV